MKEFASVAGPESFAISGSEKNKEVSMPCLAGWESSLSLWFIAIPARLNRDKFKQGLVILSIIIYGKARQESSAKLRLLICEE